MFLKLKGTYISEGIKRPGKLKTLHSLERNMLSFREKMVSRHSLQIMHFILKSPGVVILLACVRTLFVMWLLLLMLAQESLTLSFQSPWYAIHTTEPIEVHQTQTTGSLLSLGLTLIYEVTVVFAVQQKLIRKTTFLTLFFATKYPVPHNNSEISFSTTHFGTCNDDIIKVTN